MADTVQLPVPLAWQQYGPWSDLPGHSPFYVSTFYLIDDTENDNAERRRISAMVSSYGGGQWDAQIFVQEPHTEIADIVLEQLGLRSTSIAKRTAEELLLSYVQVFDGLLPDPDQS